jgi:hypothetical protein
LSGILSFYYLQSDVLLSSLSGPETSRLEEIAQVGPFALSDDHALWGAKTRSACKFDVSGVQVKALVSHAPAID